MSTHEMYRERTYYALALDPIHVGTGGYRLGQVDMTILREPGTGLPKIPGSSVAGAARAYTAMRHDRYRRYNADCGCYASCAGKGGDQGADHCGEMDCPVCVSFGFTIGPESRSFHGMAQFHDARLLFFPVHSMVGPVWVTSADALAAAGYDLSQAQRVTAHHIRPVPGLVPGENGGLNLGWLFLKAEAGDTDAEIVNLDAEAIWEALGLPEELAQLKERLVLVPNALFGVVVENNLEVRTSVSIDPATGAAEDKALFTYEAIPRSAVLTFPVTYHNPRHYMFPRRVPGASRPQPTPFPEDRGAAWVEDQVWSGLELMEHLGVGGMNTRGFGRLRVYPGPLAVEQGGMAL
jgi:CRISPR-associated protein Cmr4